MNCAAIESLTTSLAAEWQAAGVRVNCITLQQQIKQQQHQTPTAAAAAGHPSAHQAPTGTGSASSSSPLFQPHNPTNGAFSHALLFLLAPASASVSGSVVRLTGATDAAPLPPPSSAVFDQTHHLL